MRYDKTINNNLDSAICLDSLLWIISNSSKQRCWHMVYWGSDTMTEFRILDIITLWRWHTVEEKALIYNQENWVLVMACARCINLFEPQYLHLIKRVNFYHFPIIIFHSCIFTKPCCYIIKSLKIRNVEYFPTMGPQVT